MKWDGIHERTSIGKLFRSECNDRSCFFNVVFMFFKHINAALCLRCIAIIFPFPLRRISQRAFWPWPTIREFHHVLRWCSQKPRQFFTSRIFNCNVLTKTPEGFKLNLAQAWYSPDFFRMQSHLANVDNPLFYPRSRCHPPFMGFALQSLEDFHSVFLMSLNTWMSHFQAKFWL